MVGDIPKSTLSSWLRNTKLKHVHLVRIQRIKDKHLNRVRKLALMANRIKREKYLNNLQKRNKGMAELILNNRKTSLLGLAILYLGEGSKTPKGSLMLGNSNPGIIRLFLYLLRKCYAIDEKKFRCTVQCRSDQNSEELQQYWLRITKIPINQFYQTRKDARTIGRITKKQDYHGVCRIDYFSADIYNELQVIGKILIESSGPLAHLVERHNGIVEVTGSIPVRSTIYFEQSKNLSRPTE